MIRGEARLTTLIGSLDTSARAVDQTFAMAGRHLGEGLSLFEALKERLATLSAELSGRDIAHAGETLSDLAGELRGLEAALGSETRALQDIAAHSHAAGQALERLLEHMRLITILARSARIEAVSVPGVGRDFGDFANEIVTLTRQAQRTIETCARDHAHLSGLLASAMSAQRDFERLYGNALSGLAGKLGLTLAAVADRQGRSVALTGDAAAHSGRIAMAAGGAIIALQSGDSIRQRLEHAIAGLRLAASLGDGRMRAPELDEAAADAACALLHRLEAAQLQASGATLSADAEAIEAALALLQDDTAALLDLVRTLYRGDGGGSASFLGELEADLAQASDLLGRCDGARLGVDRVTQALSGVLDTCQQTIEALTATVSDIVLIGMNAGLRAARIGTGGRSLVVIAQELKVAAGQIAGDSARLKPTFTQMQAASDGLRREDRPDAAHFAGLDQAMQQSLTIMRQAADRLGATLDRLMREGEAFRGVLGQARLGFSNAGAMSDAITSASAELARSGEPASDMAQSVRAQVAALILRDVWPRYTMAAERTIHAEILAECGIAADRPAALAPVADDADEFLF